MTTGVRRTGDFCWINMLTPNPAKAREFFAKLLGLELSSRCRGSAIASRSAVAISAACSTSRVRRRRRGRRR